jgi:hypothetical protein
MVQKSAWLAAAAITLTAACATAASAQSSASNSSSPVPAQKAIFRAGVSSSGWIDFKTYTNLGIYLPVKINGHEGFAWLWGGPSSIDGVFAASIGLQAKTGAANALSGVEVQVGDLTLRNASAEPDDLQAQVYAKIIGHPLTFRLGEEVFNQVAVDIDFAHHRVAFRDPKTVSKPAGAIEVPLIELDGERVVPLSVDGAAPAQFELELGNMIGPLMVTPAYAKAHKLLEGHPTSQRLSGGRFVEPVVSLDHLNFAGVDFPQAPIALIPDDQLPPASITGGVGLPLLAKFRLIIDYSHNWLYALPIAEAVKTPVPKDRIGLVLSKTDRDVVFVAPGSPAEAAGFKTGDKIRLIDGKSIDAWPVREILKFQMADAGTTHTFTMADGTVRQVKAADFF